MKIKSIVESRDLCHVCGQTPCNCTHISEDAEPIDREWALVKKLGRLGERIAQNPRLWERYTEAVDSGDTDWIISLIQEGTGADKTEVMKLSELFGEIGGGLGRLVDFAWAVKEGYWQEDFLNPYRQHRAQGVTEGQELYGLRTGDTVRAEVNGQTVQGDVIDIFPDTMEVELLLRGPNSGQTVTVDVRDTEALNEQGVAEMDKSQPSHGRDGKISHSTYGSRDKGGSTGPERTVKATTADKMMKHAHDVMMKSMSDADKVKKGWRNPNMKEQGVAEGAGNIGAQIKAVYKKIYDAGDDAVEFAYYDSPIFAQYWDEYEGDLDSIIAEVEPSELQIILDELQSAAEDQDLNEFAPPGSSDSGDDGFSEETLKRLAAQWYNGDEDPRVERTLMAAGWEIGQDEGYDDEPGVFVVQSGDVNGSSYISWPADELRQGMAEGKPEKPEPPEADYGPEYQDMVARVKKLAGLGPLKTVWDPQKRVYKNVPRAEQPKK